MQSEIYGPQLKTYCKNVTVDEEFVTRAYENWLDGDAGRANNWRVYKEYGSPANLIAEIVREANAGTLDFGRLETRPRRDSRKERDIGVEGVKQQIVGYTIDLALDDFMRAKIGYWQVSRKGMGQFRAAPTVKRWMHQCTYHAHCDVRKCYDSISCEVVRRILRRYVRDKVVLGMVDAVLASYPGGHLMIGSYISMRLAHLVLSFGYHFVEDLHKERRGRRRALVDHQVWYADDVWLFGDDKRDLKSAIRQLERYLLKEFGLALKSWKISRSDSPDRKVRDRRLKMAEPADIAGPVVDRDRITIRAETFLKARRSLLRLRRKPHDIHLCRRFLSYWGWFKHTDSRTFCEQNGVYAAVARAKKVVSSYDRKRSKCHFKKSFTRPSRPRSRSSRTAASLTFG